MAIINSYPTVTPTGSDLIIGTDVSTTPNSTKTFTIDSINALTPQGTITSVALTMPAAFSVTGSPITSAGTFAVTGAGSTAQFIDGTGALQTIANLPFVDGTGVANRVPFFIDADTISSSGLTYTTTGGGSASNLPLFNFNSAGNADISTQRVIAVDYIGGTLSIDNIVAQNLGTVNLKGSTIIGDASTDTLTVNATSSFTAPATFSDDVIINGNLKSLKMSATSPLIFLDGGNATRLTIGGNITNNSIINESGSGDLILVSNTELEIKSGELGENYARFAKDGPIELYYDNVKKFTTLSNGVSIENGGLTVQGSPGSNSSNITLANTGFVNAVTSLKLAVGSIEKVSVDSTGTTFTGQINLTALNTAPASATATGTLGEIKFTADHIYVCVATNTWKRVAIATF